MFSLCSLETLVDTLGKSEQFNSNEFFYFLNVTRPVGVSGVECKIADRDSRAWSWQEAGAVAHEAIVQF